MRVTTTLSMTIVLILAVTIPSSAWGPKGHSMINRLAIGAAAAKLPAFMNAAAKDLIYNANEPDRWREEVDSALNIAQAPEHFFDSEYWGAIATIPGDRLDFTKQIAAKNIDLNKAGYLPYAIMENYGRLRNAFRNFRNAKTPEDRASARTNAIHYAGVLGHYVGDGTMPMHLSVHSNGWASGYPNPKNYTTDRMFHSRYETAYVDAAISESVVKSKVTPPLRLGNVFIAVKDHLGKALAELEPIYEMEKAGEFNPMLPRPKGTDFIVIELARGATMLSNLWYTAWMESAENP
jgi:hypothetical protein